MKLVNKTISLSATDLSNHLSCNHLTQLNRKHAHGQLKRPERKSRFLDRIIERGLEHEAAYINHLKSDQALTVVEFDYKEKDVVEKTLNAMRDGVGIITQGALSDEVWSGRPDLLIKSCTPSPQLGKWSYEVVDTKLTKTTKAGTMMQLCVYSEMVTNIQGAAPEKMYVVMPFDDVDSPFQIEPHRFDDYAAYFRMAKSQLIKDANEELATYPKPVSHCDICQWWTDCDNKRRNDDHLTFVAGIQKSQIVELKQQGISTLTGLATTGNPISKPLRSGSEESILSVQAQARIQQKGLQSGKPEIEFLEITYPTEKDNQLRGLLKLPAPDDADLFFDIESARHAPGGGLEYLLGFAHGKPDQPRFDCYWGLNRQDEKAAFEAFIDLAVARHEQSPGMHIYHFAPYEPAALKRLATRHATREPELDHLLRNQVFIDLYSVTRQAIRASVESYSIKCLEPFYGFERQEPLTEARNAMHELEALLERNASQYIQKQHQQAVLTYNRDDCISTLRLRDWLETLRLQQIQNGVDIPRPPIPNVSEPEENNISAELQETFSKLTTGLDNTLTAHRTPEQQARWLLAHMLEYFRREEKNAWWEYFRLRELDPLELTKERDAATGLTFQTLLPKEGREQVETHRYTYTPQFVTLEAGDELFEVSSENGERGDFKLGTIKRIDLNTQTIDIKKTKKSVDKHPASVFHHKLVSPGALAVSLHSFGHRLANLAPDKQLNSAQYDLLSRNLPRFKHCKSLSVLADNNAETPEVAFRLIKNLDNSVLAVQGPPGTGKTYTGSRVIAQLAKEGNSVAITAVSHAVIANLLNGVHEATNGNVNIAHKGDKQEVTATDCKQLTNNDKVLEALEAGTIVGATAWTWASDLLKTNPVDYLFIDEAGQMSLAMALAAAQGAKNMVLLGDPQQLEQPQRAAHPEGSEVAALSHLIGDRQTITEDQGLFLDTTYRMHPNICRFTSEQYYDGRLAALAGLQNQCLINNNDRPIQHLTFIPVEHTGNQSRSDEEANTIAALVSELLDSSHQWTNKDKTAHVLQPEDILVVAPYNAQVSHLRNTLPTNVRAGTVDKFQGQQAPVVIYSMTSSSVEDAPRGMSFLFSPNRFNVATSRAKCTVFVVGSPALVNADCQTPQQIQWVNNLCRFVELASPG